MASKQLPERLDKGAIVPLYQQVLEEIRLRITEGDYRPGDRIPSEAELSQIFGVSRVTVRRAVEELVGEGYLLKRQGKGTFVNRRKLTRKIRQSSDVQSFTDVCRAAGMVAGARLLDRRVTTPGAEERRFFGDGVDELVFVSRLRTADGTPIMEEDNYVPLHGFEFLLEADLDDVSFFETLRAGSGLSPTGCSASTIELALASARMAKVLGIGAGEPLFLENVHLDDQYGHPLCHSMKYLVGSRYVFDI